MIFRNTILVVYLGLIYLINEVADKNFHGNYCLALEGHSYITEGILSPSERSTKIAIYLEYLIF